jgi:Asp-tRNA(Asn)/Glu-tRNA(Gln) amidotransferase A subunit family amidase
MTMDFDTLISARDAIQSKRVSSVELTKQAFARIDKFDPSLHALLSTHKDRALQQASASIRTRM